MGLNYPETTSPASISTTSRTAPSPLPRRSSMERGSSEICPRHRAKSRTNSGPQTSQGTLLSGGPFALEREWPGVLVTTPGLRLPLNRRSLARGGESAARHPSNTRDIAGLSGFLSPLIHARTPEVPRSLSPIVIKRVSDVCRNPGVIVH